MLSIALSLGQLLAQTKTTITGKVTDDKGSPIANASVIVKGSQIGTTAGTDGTFSLDIPSTAKKLVISAVGYANKEAAITNAPLSVMLQKEIKTTDDDVLIVGYGKQKKKNQVGATTVLNSKAFDQVPIASFDNILQGKSSGVQVTSQNGRPGSPAFVRVRGVGSLNAGQAPLVIIDGLPTTLDNFNLINPNDIENVSILKDASAASIYGSRASNGVILVTTKKGKVGQASRPQLSYRFQYGLSSKIPDMNFRMMTAAEKLQYEYELAFTNPTVAAEIKARGLTGNVTTISAANRQAIWDKLIANQNDWQDILLRQAPLSSHEISLSGASDKITYYFSTNFYKENGIGLGSDFKRTVARLNVEYKAKDWFKIGTNSTVGFTNENLLRDRLNTQSPFVAMYWYNTYENPKKTDGSWNTVLAGGNGINILEAIQNNPENSKKISGLTTVYGEFSFLKHLVVRSELGLNFINFRRTYFIKPGSQLDLSVGDRAAPGNKRDNGFWDVTRSWTNTATWTQTFNQNHNVDLLIGTEYNDNKVNTYSFNSKGFPGPNFSEQTNGAVPLTTSTNTSEWTLVSGFTRARYNYKETYFGEASFRRDGSSRFGANNRYGNFWSFGAGWNIAKENFFKVKEINALKLRTSLGTSGNFNIDNYQSLGLYGFSRYNSQSTSFPIQLPNPDLTWESNFNYDIGLDFEAFNSRLTGSIEYYNRKTYNLLFNVPKSITTGFTTRLENVGEMVNKGMEITLGYDVLRMKDLRWNITGNVSFNKNKVTKLYGGVTNFVDEVGIGKVQIGEPINVYFLNRWVGVNPADGSPQYLDKNGNTVSVYDPSDAVVLSGKSPDPRYYGNVNNTISYKGFGLSFDVYFSGGNYIYNNGRQFLNSDGQFKRFNQAVSALNYWKKPGDNADFPNPQKVSNSSYDTDLFLEKGDFMRLRNMTLSYVIPVSVFGKLKIQGIRVYAQGQNLLTRTKFIGDPEVGIGMGENIFNRNGSLAQFSYPTSRRITFGIDVTF